MKRKNNGFTLVEILIVVIILGILAAIVIPQFTQASDDARESALSSDLQTMRSQLELYRVQHTGGQYPNGATTAAWTAQLTGKTDPDGVADAAGIYGPYLPKMPSNPFAAGLSTVSISALAPAGDDSTGWHFNTSNGKFSPNDSKSTSSGTAHKDF